MTSFLETLKLKVSFNKINVFHVYGRLLKDTDTILFDNLYKKKMKKFSYIKRKNELDG